MRLELNRVYIIMVFFTIFISCDNSNKKKDLRKELTTDIDINNTEDLKFLLEDSNKVVNNAIRTKEKKKVTHEIGSKEIVQKQTESCDISLVNKVNENIDLIDYQDIYNFLCSFDETCKNNVEFTEYSNKTLFKLLQFYPRDVVFLLSNYPKLESDYLYRQLSAPLLDYDIQSMCDEILKSEGMDGIKERVIKELKKSDKY